MNRNDTHAAGGADDSAVGGSAATVGMMGRMEEIVEQESIIHSSNDDDDTPKDEAVDEAINNNHGAEEEQDNEAMLEWNGNNNNNNNGNLMIYDNVLEFLQGAEEGFEDAEELQSFGEEGEEVGEDTHVVFQVGPAIPEAEVFNCSLIPWEGYDGCDIPECVARTYPNTYSIGQDDDDSEQEQPQTGSSPNTESIGQDENSEQEQPQTGSSDNDNDNDSGTQKAHYSDFVYHGGEIPPWIKNVTKIWHGLTKPGWSFEASETLDGGKRTLTIIAPVWLLSCHVGDASLMSLSNAISAAAHDINGPLGLSFRFGCTAIQCELEELLDFLRRLKSKLGIHGDLLVDTFNCGDVHQQPHIEFSTMASLVHAFCPSSLELSLTKYSQNDGLEPLLEACHTVALKELKLFLWKPTRHQMRELAQGFAPLHKCMEKVSIEGRCSKKDVEFLTKAIVSSAPEELSLQYVSLDLKGFHTTAGVMATLSTWLISLRLQTLRMRINGFTESQTFLTALQQCHIPHLYLRFEETMQGLLSQDYLMGLFQVFETGPREILPPLFVTFQGHNLLVPTNFGLFLQSLGKMKSIKCLRVIDLESMFSPHVWNQNVHGEQIVAALRQNTAIQQFDIMRKPSAFCSNPSISILVDDNGFSQQIRAVLRRNKAIAHVAEWTEVHCKTDSDNSTASRHKQEHESQKFNGGSHYGSGAILAPMLSSLSLHYNIEDDCSLQADPCFRLLRHEVGSSQLFCQHQVGSTRLANTLHQRDSKRQRNTSNEATHG